MYHKIGEKEYYLAPCPFCGADVAEFATVWSCEMCGNFQEEVCPNYVDEKESEIQPEDECGIHLVVCPANRKGCGASTGWHISREEAAKAWHRRVYYGE